MNENPKKSVPSYVLRFEHYLTDDVFLEGITHECGFLVQEVAARVQKTTLRCRMLGATSRSERQFSAFFLLWNAKVCIFLFFFLFGYL